MLLAGAMMLTVHANKVAAIVRRIHAINTNVVIIIADQTTQ
jgi:hypothetical protein